MDETINTTKQMALISRLSIYCSIEYFIIGRNYMKEKG